jgi:hypothetical protein
MTSIGSQLKSITVKALPQDPIERRQEILTLIEQYEIALDLLSEGEVRQKMLKEIVDLRAECAKISVHAAQSAIRDGRHEHDGHAGRTGADRAGVSDAFRRSRSDARPDCRVARFGNQRDRGDGRLKSSAGCQVLRPRVEA